MGFCAYLTLLFVTSSQPLDQRMDAPVGEAGFAFVDVGQGAALVVIGSQREVYVVDSGPPRGAPALLDVLAWSGRRVVDLWAHTHYDDDHVGAFVEVMSGADKLPGSSDDLEVRRLWDRGDEALPSNLATSDYMAWSEAHQVPRGGELGASFVARDWWIGVVGRGAPTASSENERGLALCGELLGTRFFLQGDLPARLALAAARSCGPVDLFWLGHHGAKDALDASGEMLRALDPTLVVISSGQDNAYCHPHPHTLERLRDRRVVILGLPETAANSACRIEAKDWSAEHRWEAQGLWVPAG